MSAQIKVAMCFRNGGIAVFDEKGEQIPELQVGWPVLWAQHAEKLGFDPDGVGFEVQDSNYRTVIRRNADGGFNWEMIR